MLLTVHKSKRTHVSHVMKEDMQTQKSAVVRSTAPPILFHLRLKPHRSLTI